MNKEDKKFLCALAFAQLGILAGLIMFSPYYWHTQVKRWDATEELAKYGLSLKTEVRNLESEEQVNALKRGYENSDIGVEETWELNKK